MSITNQRLALYRGETFEVDFAIVDSAGAPVNITGWPLALVVVGQRENGTTYQIKKTIADGVTILSGSGGTGKAILSKTDTGSLEYGSHYYALIDDDPADSAVLADGSLTVLGPRIL